MGNRKQGLRLDIATQLGYNAECEQPCVDLRTSRKVAADMTLQTVSCPQCDGPMSLADEQRHIECAHCGSKFVADWTDSRSVDLTLFESVLARSLDEVSVQATQQRLTELEDQIPQAQRDVQARHEQLDEAKTAYEARRVAVQKVIAPPQNWTYFLGLMTFVAWFLVWFVLQSVEWYVFLALSVLLIPVTWVFYRSWRNADLWAQDELHLVRLALEEADSELSEAYARLEDHMLERELRQRVVANYELLRASESQGRENSVA